MREHPILFNGEMVKAILEGRKTQTRRVFKKTPHGKFLSLDYLKRLAWNLGAIFQKDKEPYNIHKCPYGQVGDRLWVRETIQYFGHGSDPNVHYCACHGKIANSKVIPSIHMPRWASKITLEITDIRVERVQDISEKDAMVEGCGRYPDYNSMKYTFRYSENEVSSANFHILWNSINEKRGFGWDSNPWVWVVEFKVIK